MTIPIKDSTTSALPRSESLPLTPLRTGEKLPSHIPALDGIRGLAVLLILFCHGTLRPFDEATIDSIFSGPINKLTLLVARLSWSGVDLFFVLSGFLITGILFDAKGKKRFFTNFYARRTVRIFPLYYAYLILFLVIWPHLPAALNKGFGQIYTSKIWYWLYLSNYSQGIVEQAGKITDHIVHVSWSLSIEEQFYLCWPLIVFLCRRETLLKICGAMFFGSMALRIVALIFGKYWWAMNFTPTRVDGLAVGALIALTARGPNGLAALARHARWAGPSALAALLAMIVLMYKLGFHHGMGQSPGYVICGTSLLAIAFGSLLLLAATALNGSIMHRIFAHPILRTFGKYSYAAYLLHFPVFILTANYIFHPTQLRIGQTLLPGLIVYYAITWPLVLAAALISWHGLEKHFLKLKDFFPMEKKASTATAWEGAEVSQAEKAA